MKAHRKRRRRIRKGLIAALTGSLFLVVFLCYLPGFVTSARLKKLGYDRTTIRNIRSEKLDRDILSHQYYSEYLAKAINDGTMNRNYMYLYTVLDANRTLTDDDFLLYNRLVDKGYETDQLVNLYQNLTFREIVPLLVFDYQWDESIYIDDVISNRDSNTSGTFHLTNTYITYYQTSEEVSDKNTDMLVNQSYLLNADYTPENLTTVSSEHAVDGLQLTEKAADAFSRLSAASVIADHSMYASVGYIAYASQETAYTYYVNHVGSDNADYYAQRAGSSEHQTGLGVDVSLTYENNDDFTSTGAYAWLKEHAAEYGFILRYPDELSVITGHSEPDHLRYLGKDLACKVKKSDLSYDEYYLLYLSSWNDRKLIPDSSVLSGTDYQEAD